MRLYIFSYELARLQPHASKFQSAVNLFLVLYSMSWVLQQSCMLNSGTPEQPLVMMSVVICPKSDPACLVDLTTLVAILLRVIMRMGFSLYYELEFTF